MADLLTPRDLLGIQRAFENALRTAPNRNTTQQRSPSPAPTAPIIDTSSANSSLTAFGNTMSNASSSFTNLKNNLDDSLDNFQRMSEVGANFSNDIGVMTLSADMARTSMSEFSDVVINNNKNFAGLGGSVSRGSEVFAKMSNAFFDSGMTDGLRELGYSTKDINELLAQQISTSRMADYNDEVSKRKLFDTTLAYGKELDKLSKLTGQSRKQLTAELETRENQAKVQARLNIIRQTQGPEAAAKAEAELRKNYAKAQAEGVGDMFLEMFATGGAVISEKAQQQLAMSGQAGSLAGEVAVGLSRGEVEGADAKMAESQTAMAAQMNDLSFSTMVTLGGALGGLGDTAVNLAADNQALSDAVRKAAQATDTRAAVDITTKEGLAEATRRANEELEKSARGYNAAGEKVDGLTQGMIDAHQGIKDLKAKASEEVLKPSKDGKSLMDVARAGGEAASTGVDYARQMEPVADKFVGGVRDAISGIMSSTGTIVEKLEAIGTQISDALTGVHTPPTTTPVTPPAPTPPAPTTPPTQVIQPVHRRTGSWGMTGSVLEDFGEGTLAMLHDREGVVTESQLNELVGNAKSLGVSSMLGTLINSAKNNSFDLPSTDNVKSDVTSNISVNVDNTEIKQDDSKQDTPAIRMFSKELSDMSDSMAQASTNKVTMPEFDYSKITNDITTSLKFPDFSKIAEQFQPPKIEDIKIDMPETKVVPFDIDMSSLNKQKFTVLKSIDEITNGVASSINKQYDITKSGNDNIINAQQQLNDKILSSASTLNDVSFEGLNSSLSNIAGSLSKEFSNFEEPPEIKIGDEFKNQINKLTDDFNKAPKLDLTNIKDSISEESETLGDSFNFDSIQKSLMDLTKPLQSTVGGIFSGVFGDLQKGTDKYSVMITDSFGTVSNDINQNSSQFTAKIGKLFGDVTNFEHAKKAEPPKPTTAEIKQPPKEPTTSTTQIKPNLDSVDYFGPNKKTETKAPEPEKPKAPEPKKEESSAQPPIKDNTDEIVKQLNKLNMQMSMLVSQHEELGMKQLRATKANSNNLFEH